VGRKKTYDRDELIGEAMEMFRDHGFAGTSTQMLVDGLAVNRYSLYAEFDTKQGLFDAALKRYDDEVLGHSFGPLEAPDAGLPEIRTLLEFYALASDSPGWGRGCLLCNTAIEFGANDPGGAGYIERYFERLSGAFTTALSNAHRTGQLKAAVDPSREADFLTASVLGIFVMLRAKAPPTSIEATAHVAIQHLETLRTEAERTIP
jgi:TetR/AcrR family transcriptional repressor of nem operon